jgi:hypothetical protein
MISNIIRSVINVCNELKLNNIGFNYVLRRNIIVIEDIKVQPTLAAVTHLAEGLAVAQCRASSSQLSVIIVRVDVS